MKRVIFLIVTIGTLLVACSSSQQPTATPLPPTATPVPTVVITGKGVTITLPDSYIGGSQEDVDMLIERLNEMGGSYAEAAKTLKDNPEMYLIYAYDTKMGSTGALTNVNVATMQLPSGITLESQMQSVIDAYENAGFTDIEKQACVHDENECIELRAAQTVNGIKIQVLQYFVKKGVDAYLVTFGTEISEFPERYPEFSQAFNTFQILED